MAAILPRPSEPDDPTFAELLAARPAFSMHAMDGLLLEDVPLNAVADAVVMIGVEAELLDVEGLGPVHIGHGDGDELELEVHGGSFRGAR